MEPPALREQMEATALLDQAEPRERMALTVQAVHPARPEAMAPQGPQARPDQQGVMVHRGRLEWMARQALLERQVPMGLQVAQEQVVRMAVLEHQALMEVMERPVHQERVV